MEEQKSKENIIIIDGYGFLFRAFFSLKDLKTTQGVPIGAVYGFINMFLKLNSSFKSKYIVLVFDSGKKTFRTEIFEEYKANRKEAPEDLKPQFAIIREAVNALNIPYIQIEGFEADDVIASYCKKYHKEYNIIVASSDKDLTQLLTFENVQIFDPLKNKFITKENVVEKFGVKPHQIVDFLAIVGDSSDNIPGVAGIGEKGASELLSSFQNLEEVYENLEQISKPKLKNALEKSKEMAFISKKLASLEFNVNILEIETFTKKAFENEKLYEFLKKYEMHSLIAKILPDYKQGQMDLFSANEAKTEKILDIKTEEISHFFKNIQEIVVDAKDGKITIKEGEKLYNIVNLDYK